MISQTYVTSVIIILTTLLPLFGFKVENEQLTQFIQAVVVVAGGIYIIYRKIRSGEINVLGVKQG